MRCLLAGIKARLLVCKSRPLQRSPDRADRSSGAVRGDASETQRDEGGREEVRGGQYDFGSMLIWGGR